MLRMHGDSERWGPVSEKPDIRFITGQKPGFIRKPVFKSKQAGFYEKPGFKPVFRSVQKRDSSNSAIRPILSDSSRLRD